MPKGRPPKPAHLRQNKTKKAGRATLEAPVRARIPKLVGPDDHAWHELTLKWWRKVWKSPMAGEYLDTDVDGLARLALLIDAFYHSGDPKLMAEIRLQEARFGLSPVDRSRLQWEVAKGEEAANRRGRTTNPATKPDTSSGDPRELFKIVS